MSEQEVARREWNPADHGGLTRQQFGDQFKPTQEELFGMLSHDVYRYYGYGGRGSFLTALEEDRVQAAFATIEAKKEADLQAFIVAYEPTLEAIDASDCSKKRPSSKK